HRHLTSFPTRRSSDLSRQAYQDFKHWAEGEGYSPNGLPNINNFVQRLRAAGPSKGIAYKHSGRFRGFLGMRLRPSRAAALADKVDRKSTRLNSSHLGI